MANLKELREQGGAAAAEIRRMADIVGKESRDFNAEERATWEKVNKDYDACLQQVAIAERAEEVQKRMAAPAGDTQVGRDEKRGGPAGDGAALPTEEHRSLAFGAWCRTQMGMDIDQRQQEACGVLKFNPNKRNLEFNLYPTETRAGLATAYRSAHVSQAHEVVEKRALSGSLGSAGAFTIAPETLVRQLEINMLYFSGILQVAEVLRTTTGEPLSWPTANDTGNKARRIGEAVAVNLTPDPTFGKITWGAHDYTSDAVLIPNRLLEDNVFNLPDVIGAMLGERHGRKTNLDCTTGLGGSEPQGIATAAGTGVTAASATAIAADELIRLVHSIDPAYRSTGCGWMLHDNILMAIRLLKDGMGQYLWMSGLQQGVPDKLLGYSATINQDMQSTVATGTKTVLFGQLNKYKVRQVAGVRFYRLQERYRDQDCDGFVAYMRMDGGLLNAGTNPVKALVQA
jgi:HK97 family phage major capsid protein